MDSIIAGALFDFAASLTTGKDIIAGATHHPEPLLTRLSDWAHGRGLYMDTPETDWVSKGNQLKRATTLELMTELADRIDNGTHT